MWKDHYKYMSECRSDSLSFAPPGRESDALSDSRRKRLATFRVLNMGPPVSTPRGGLGAGAAACDEYCGDFLRDCAEGGDAEGAAAALRNGVPADDTDEGGGTALMNAAYGGHVAIARLLVERGADVRHVDEDGVSALM